MVSLKHLNTLFERFGLLNMHHHQFPWQETLQNVYVNFSCCLFLFHILCHLFSTVTRATQYWPEFCQALLEDCIIFYLAYAAWYLRLNVKSLDELSDLMENSFSKADKKIVAKSHYSSKMTCIMFVTAVFLAISGSFLETLLPITKSELEIRRNIYKTAHPERRLPYPLRLPFIDETESPYYEVLYILDFIIMFYFAFWTGLAVSCVPVISIHVRGQYEILGKYIAKLGHVHRDQDGYQIFYNNIEKDEYYIKLYSPILGKKKLIKLTEKLKRKRQYESAYVRQIVHFHFKLITFRDKWMSILGPIVYGLIFANTIIISLCLYQTVVSPSQISTLRAFKFIAELISVNMEYFIICNSSEMFDDCHTIVLRAFTNSNWQMCSNKTKRDLCMFLRRAQKPNHLRFYNGAVVINAPFFLKVLQTAYTFVNYLRLRVGKT